MSRFFYTRLAINNIRKNGKNYIPYIFTCIFMVMMVYIMTSLSNNPGIRYMRGAAMLDTILKMGSVIVSFFAVIFLFYTNSFLMKRRKKEFGLFNILGLEKKHLAAVVAHETFFIAVLSLGLGLILGIALDKILFLLIAHMLEAEVTLGFYISFEVIRYTVIMFAILFALIFLKAVNMIRLANPIELLHGGNVGEKEPKTKWLMALIGAVTLAAGYYIALTVENPFEAVTWFFVAVILVIIGTYFLFTAGSIALLKILKKNKNYYYKTRHFISVSGMIYRMKQNAVGLANICVLSTFVLVMVATTTSLVVGMEDTLRNRYPNDFALYLKEYSEENINEKRSLIRDICRREDLDVKNENGYAYLEISAVKNGNRFDFNMDSLTGTDMLKKVKNVIFSTVDDYNAITGENVRLNNGEALIYANREAFGSDSIRIFDREYRITKVLDKFYGNGTIAADIVSSYYVVIPDMEELKALGDCALKIIYAGESEMENKNDVIRYYYGFDSDADKTKQFNVYNAVKEELRGINGYVEIKEENRLDFISLYGGLFFLGIFLSTLFVMAAVLIIYYKQISEGYDDKERFNIMQKVGMSRKEVKSAINSQVLTVFFLPLIVAGIHLAAAFPLLSKLLSALSLNNSSLYALFSVAAFVVFAVIYVIIYNMTAKVYYRIVSIK